MVHETRLTALRLVGGCEFLRRHAPGLAARMLSGPPPLILVTADQLQPAVRDASGGAVVSSQAPLALVPPELLLVIHGRPVRARLRKLGNVSCPPEADVSVRSSTQNERGTCFVWWYFPCCQCVVLCDISRFGFAVKC